MNLLKNAIKQQYAIFACSEDDVYYLLGNKSINKWIESSQIEDCRNMIIFESKSNAKDQIKYVRESGLVPVGCDAIELLTIIPTYNETDGYWYEEIKHERIKL